MSSKRRYYPSTGEESTNALQQQSAPQYNQPGGLGMNDTSNGRPNVFNAPSTSMQAQPNMYPNTFQPAVQPSTPYYSQPTSQPNPIQQQQQQQPPPMLNPLQQTTHQQQQQSQPVASMEPSFGSSLNPPVSQSQMSPPPTSPTSASQQQTVVKHKHVFALDPEGSYSSADQLASGMSQMGLGTSATGQPSGAANPQMYSAPNVASNQVVEEPVSVSSQMQCPAIYMRMSINAVPDTSNLLNKCGIPFGCVVHPMAETTNPQVLFLLFYNAYLRC